MAPFSSFGNSKSPFLIRFYPVHSVSVSDDADSSFNGANCGSTIGCCSDSTGYSTTGSTGS